ncbi:MAG: hypothetical protein AAF266_04130 [Planctomycetota bacterium]
MPRRQLCRTHASIEGTAMRVRLLALTALLATTCSPPAFANTELLDIDALEGAFAFALPSPDQTELVAFLDPAVGPNRLEAVSIADGTLRTLPTAGIDVGRFNLQSFSDRILLSDAVTDEPFAVSLTGTAPPSSLLPEPGQSAFANLAPNGGGVSLIVPGDPDAIDPADRDRLYTRSITGGPAVEITNGDLPRFREFTFADFSDDGQTVVAGVYDRRNVTAPTLTAELWLATLNQPGLTQVLTDNQPDTRYLPIGSDEAGEYFLTDSFRSNLFGSPGALYSIPLDNPAAATRLDVDAEGISIVYEQVELDAAGSRVLFTSRLPGSQQPGFISTYRLMEAPLDGSSLPSVITELPPSREPSRLQLIPDSPWKYVLTLDDFVGGEGENLFAVNSVSAEVVTFTSPGGLGIQQNEYHISADGEMVLFTDNRDAGNDLYLASVTDGGVPVTLLDVPDTDRLVDILLSEDERFAVVGLLDANVVGTRVADRFLAVPLDGGAPTTLADATVGPVAAQFGANNSLGPWLFGDQFVYGRGDAEGQVGLFRVGLPSTALAADFNGDGIVDLLDLDILGANFGDLTGLAPGDANGDGNVDLLDLDILGSQFGSTASTAIPEPASSFMLAVALVVASGRCRDSR